MQDMEPTDRCLRLPGDIYPADGTHLGKRGFSKRLGRDLKAMPGDEPFDGEHVPGDPVTEPLVVTDHVEGTS